MNLFYCLSLRVPLWCAWICFFIPCGSFGAGNPDEKIIRLDNSIISIEISLENGDAISLTDRRTGRQFISKAKNRCDLYRLTIVDPTGKIKNWSNKDAQVISWQSGKDHNEVVFNFQKHQNKDINVKILVKLEQSGFLRMTADIDNNEDVAIQNLELPSFSLPSTLGESPWDDVLVLPLFDGLTINNLSRKGIRHAVKGNYPGSASVQFFSFFDSDGGIYIASEDSSGSPKAFGYRLKDGNLRLFIENRFPEEMGKDVHMNYTNTIRFLTRPCDGQPVTWYDAADVYKAWALKQSWTKQKIKERTDIPYWFKKGTVILDYPIQRKAGRIIHEEIPGLLQSYSDFLDMQIITRPRGWEKHGSWIGPDTFPAFEEKRFLESIARMKSSGNRLFLYLEGYQWMLQEPNYNYDGNEFFENFCKSCAVERRDGPWVFNHKGRKYAQGCRTTERAQEMLYDNAIKCVELGADVLQIEVVGGGGTPCYNPKHSHPPGYGRWLYERFADLLRRVRRDGRKINTDFVLSIEEPCELYIPFLDGYNSRDFRELQWPRHIPHSKGIPLFTYLYHEYVLGFSGYHRNFLTKGKRLYHYRNVAMNFISGKMNGFNLINRPEDIIVGNHSTEARGFMKDTVQMTHHAGHKYLLMGTMLRPAVIECDQIQSYYPDVRSSNKSKPKGKNWSEASVLHSVWQAPTGELGYVFANYTKQSADFNVNFSRGDIIGDSCKMVIHRPGKDTVVNQNVALPSIIAFHLEPRKVMLIELKARQE